MTVLTPGQVLQNGKYSYTIERELRTGRFSISYLSKRSDGERWIIKVLNSQVLIGLDDSEKARQESLFWQEAVKLSKCSGSPYIAKVEMPFKAGNLVCLPTEYLDCNSLAERSERQLVEQTALNYIQHIGKALTEAHKQGLVHRDIRPANIQLKIRQDKVEAILTNFELAVDVDTELTRTRKLELTDGFSPMELYARAEETGYAISSYTDVYSLSATLYELLTGEIPLNAKDRKAKEQKLISPQALNPNISGKTTKAILEGMELLPNKRPQSVQQWLSKLITEPKQQKNSQTNHVDWGKWGAIFTIIGVVVTILASLSAWLPSREPNSQQTSPSTPVEQSSPQSMNRLEGILSGEAIHVV